MRPERAGVCGTSSAEQGCWGIREWRCDHVFQWKDEVGDGLFAGT
jgi:hypothetical protein